MRHTLLVLFLCCGLGLGVRAETPVPAEKTNPKDEATHKELIKLREDLVEALKKDDLDGMLKLLDDNVVVTFMNAEVARTPAKVKEYFEKMMKGDKNNKPIVAHYKPDPEVDERTHLYADNTVGVAFGSSNDLFQLTDGRDFTIPVRWTAVATKQSGQWKIAAFHASANVFDNPILHIALRRTSYWIGGIAGGGGILIGLCIGLCLRRRKAAAPSAPGAV